ncbi:MAG: hypothetical protein Q9167_005027 [Letrouitia subvulpina]
MGNPLSNSLPRCQLLRLRKLIFETYSPEYSPFYDGSSLGAIFVSTARWGGWQYRGQRNPYHKINKKRIFFWMDTLCIPVSNEAQVSELDRDLKFRAMKNITPIFAGAYTTLVLDKGLQSIQIPDSSKIQGDEFAAVIISSNWMQRGWTLEEGSLSSSCVFQMMDKPYEIGGSLHNSLPNPEEVPSPLMRASMKARLQLPIFLRKALADDMKLLPQDPRSWRASRYTKMLRLSQFVWTWNSLLERSTTKPHDGPIILANLLDFNAFGLKSIPHKERLRALIDSCDDIPFSLLYNVNLGNSTQEVSSVSWVPEEIAGSHLVAGVALRRNISSGKTPQAKFFIDISDSDPNSFFALTLSPHSFPEHLKIFKIQLPPRRNSNTVREFIIELHPSQPDQIVPDDHRGIWESNTGRSSKGICLILDLAVGSASQRGFSGKGVIFGIDSVYSKGLALKYGAPLTFWTQYQWQHSKDSALLPSMPLINAERISRRQQLVLKCDAPVQDRSRLFRRPLLTQHPLQAVLPAALILLLVLLIVIVTLGFLYVTIIEALGFKLGPSPHAAVIVILFGPILGIFIYDPIRSRLAMFTYMKWVKSFNEGDDGCSLSKSQEDAGRRKFGYFRMMNEIKRVGAYIIPRRKNRATAPHAYRNGLTQVSIRLPTRRPYQDVEGRLRDTSTEDDVAALSEEFPGEVFLD